MKQCDDNCGDSCDNARIYISNLPPDVTTEELRDLFGGIGQVMFSSVDLCTSSRYMEDQFLCFQYGLFCFKVALSLTDLKYGLSFLLPCMVLWIVSQT